MSFPKRNSIIAVPNYAVDSADSANPEKRPLAVVRLSGYRTLNTENDVMEVVDVHLRPGTSDIYDLLFYSPKQLRENIYLAKTCEAVVLSVEELAPLAGHKRSIKVQRAPVMERHRAMLLKDAMEKKISPTLQKRHGTFSAAYQTPSSGKVQCNEMFAYSVYESLPRKDVSKTRPGLAKTRPGLGRRPFRGVGGALGKGGFRDVSEKSGRASDLRCNYSPDGPLVLVLDAPTLLTERTLKRVAGLKSEQIVVPNCFEFEAMSAKKRKSLFRMTVGQYLDFAGAEGRTFVGTWLDYCGTFGGNADFSPAADIAKYFKLGLARHNSVFAVTFTTRDGNSKFYHQSEGTARSHIEETAHSAGYRAVFVKKHAYASMYYLQYKIVCV
jgi:hypothetical protein